MRKYFTFDVKDSKAFKRKLVHFCRHFNYSAVYDSCNYYEQEFNVNYHTFDVLVGLDHVNVVKTSFDAVQNLHSNIKDWLFGYWSYDLKNDLEKLYSINSDNLNFSTLCFFQPRYIIQCVDGLWKIGYLETNDSESEVYKLLDKINGESIANDDKPVVNFKAKVSKDKYCQSIDAILDHIHKGDIYELNYCMEFFDDNTTINPYNTYCGLVDISPTPFASFFKVHDKYVLSASPERYIKKDGNKIVSQPIKGTSKRGFNAIEDQILKENLMNCVKERSENIMIADLVRNDLARVAKRGTVNVEELCGIYPFRQVFQMVTTIVAQLDDNKQGVEAIKASFPAGSMTGAPKIRAMKLIEKYEETKRGVYSGAIGYFSPEGDFDFNVVIRSLFYNAATNYLSFMVGSAITEKSLPNSEYDECLLKAKAILQLFNQDKISPND